MSGLLVNIDVPDLEAGIAFYTAALGLTVSRRFDSGFAELAGTDAPIYLLENPPGSRTGPSSDAVRDYARHWTPVHPDFTVEDLEKAIARAVEAGAVQEGEMRDAAYGRIATFADPFGHGFCLIEFSERGYDALLD